MAPKDKDEPAQNVPEVHDPDAPGPPISVPDNGDSGEGGKLKMIVQLVKKCLGVKDIAAMRLSLPASLLEPIPNLEFSQYLDRPDVFASVNDYDDPFDRMLAVIRFAMTKDLKYIRGKVCKPYNSVLGEHFRAHWDVPPLVQPNDRDEAPIPQTHLTHPGNLSSEQSPNLPNSDGASVKSTRSSKSFASGVGSFMSKGGKSPSTTATSVLEADMSQLNLQQDSNGEKLRVVYLTEQISHHPPISAYYASCPERHVELLGVDQISAKVSGTALRVSPGGFNKGMFVRLTSGHGEGEMYQLTHPMAWVNGILRGSFYVTVSDSMIVTCEGGRHGTKFRAIIEYKEESWLGKPHFLIEGVIHTVPEGDTQHEEWTKVKHVPPSRVVAVLDGTWRGLVRWKRVGTGSYMYSPTSPHKGSHTAASSPNPSQTHIALPSASTHANAASSKADLVMSTGSSKEDWNTLIDLSALWVVPKQVRPIERQVPFESRKLWENVTSRLLKKEYNEATKEKVAIEQRQRDEAAERKKKGVEFIPKYFEKDISTGIPTLTEEGRKAVEEEVKEIDWEVSGDNDKLAP
ncbi:hypothetical protein K435DRAFT_858722 [Dendrothele bispora CBS 962.96]|uniref:Oxysterol-binding protein n=1 Tax=Dendrothele bispora (strain CBS 962.96) TaxID=1314807 RepID=A0A4S8M2Q0_DENBC|nr:hypothetical protein K435DRAFT_858722 [Dendrothele bispora CBS 962.96]